MRSFCADRRFQPSVPGALSRRQADGDGTRSSAAEAGSRAVSRATVRTFGHALLLAVVVLPAMASAELRARLVEDIYPGPQDGLGQFRCGAGPWSDETCDDYFVAVGDGFVWLTANDGVTGNEPWRSDGTPDGTFQLADVYPGPMKGPVILPLSTTHRVVDGVLYFLGADGTHGRELWRSTGTQAGTSLLADVNPGEYGSHPRLPISYHGALFFSARSPGIGRELWTSDGTAEGTRLFLDLAPGDYHSQPRSSDPGGFVVSRGLLFFFASADPDPALLWRSDGTRAGTTVLRSFEQPRRPRSLDAVGGKLLLGIVYLQSYRLYEVDHDSGELRWVRRVTEGSPWGPWATVVAGETLFLQIPARDLRTSTLWRSDGTTAGTFSLAAMDIDGPLAVIGGDRVFFRGVTAGTGSEPWVSDGTLAGTRLLRDVLPGPESSEAQDPTVWQGDTYFVADDGVHGRELWATDGTREGTRPALETIPGPASLDPRHLAATETRLFFAGADNVHGRELWAVEDLSGGPTDIPTLGPWGALALATGLGLMALARLRRR